MAHIAPHSHHEPLPKADWLSEFPPEGEMDSAWSQRPVDEDPFDDFAREESAGADVPLLRPGPEPPVTAIEPMIRVVDVAPAAGARRAPIAASAVATAALAVAMFLVTPRTITTPDLPPHLVPPIAAAPAPPASALAPPDAAIAAPPEPPQPKAPPVGLEPPNHLRASVKPPPPTPPPARPAPASSTTTTGTPQQLPPPPPPALALSPAPGSPPAGSIGTSPVVVSPPPDLPPPPAATSAPPPAPTPPPIDLAAATVAAEAAAIDVVLGGYRRAFSVLDVERVAQVWPTVDRRALERAFRGLAKQTFEFHSCQVQPNGTEALASCSGRASYVPKVGGRATQVETREWQFTLTKRSGRWLITSVESKR